MSCRLVKQIRIEIKDIIKEAEEQVYKEALEKEKEQAKNDVGQLKYLSADAMSGYISEVDNATSIEGVSEIVKRAQEKNDELC